MEHATGLRVEVRLARSRSDIEACQQLMAETYLRAYGVVLTYGEVEPDGGVERFPDRYVMGLVGDELVASAGLYVHETYVERYGHLQSEEIARVTRAAGIEGGELRPRVEYTKAVVDPRWGRRGIGRHFIGATHSRAFLAVDGADPLVLCCGKLSVFRNLYEPVGLHTRTIKAFPLYRNHARYRTPNDPMESRLSIPELDIDPKWYHRPMDELNLKLEGSVHAY